MIVYIIDNLASPPPHTMKHLYKYRPFDTYTLNMLSNSEVFYANPTSFNDPLDCKPTLTIDVSFLELEQLCFKMLEIEYGTNKATAEIDSCRYYATEPENIGAKERESYHCRLLSNEITRLLHLKMKKRGVLSLAGRWDSCLMWSHYADEHKGVCLEYDMKEAITFDSKDVKYNEDRALLVSSIVDWIYNPSLFSQADIDDKYFFTKAKAWEYEKETRFLENDQGVSSAPFHLSAVYFGMRCAPAVISSIIKLMDGTRNKLNFYKVHVVDGSFDLRCLEIDKEDVIRTSPRESARMAFSPFRL
ncbi:MAG: DUF2971 domain-containing protein [Colwellia sp.]|nr:DUF2971 domain-containing protein [Colwellia sp.]